MAKKYTDDYLLGLIKNYMKDTGIVPKAINLSASPYIWTNRFGSYKNALALCGVDMKKGGFHRKEYTKDELLSLLKKYNNEVGIPTLRGISAHKDYPSGVTYHNKFGSFQNALKLAGIYNYKREHFFNRKEYSKDVVDGELKKLIDYNLKKHRTITTNDLSNSDKLPDLNYLSSKWGYDLNSIYSRFGYDKNKLDEEFIRKKLLIKYKELSDLLGRNSTSRDIDFYKQNYNFGYSAKTYDSHFKSYIEIQELCGLDVTQYIINRHKTKDDLKIELIDLSKKINRIPTVWDVSESPECSSLTKYKNSFGSFEEALVESGLIPKNRLFYTYKNKVKVNSYYEVMFGNMLEYYDIEYSTENLYKEIIEDINSNHRFDFRIEINNNIYFIEIFGLKGYNYKYDSIMEWKINICKKNNINLICMYPDDIYNDYEKTYEILKNKLKSIKDSVNL